MRRQLQRFCSSAAARDFLSNDQPGHRIFRLCRLGSSAVGLAGLALAGSQPANAACLFVPTAGSDTFVCDSGTAAALNGLGGNDTLTFPAGGTGAITGNVVFGAGQDLVRMESGSIGGNVQQGAGIDDFQMLGGVVQSLSQGDNIDTFFMSGGRIIDFFEDGDRAVMTGGRIGRVNMKLDDNLFDMSGGIIDGNLVTGFGNDTFILSSGTIGGNISLSGGADSATVTGGTIGGNVLMSVGADTFTWAGGIIYGAIDLGGDNDTATLRDLGNANIGATTQITGGPGTDSITLDNVSMGGLARLQGWETVAATNDTELTFDGALTLGDVGTGTGTLIVDTSSTLFGGGTDAAVSAFAAGQLASVVNSGRIDLTNAGGGTSDTFTINGDYFGNGGLLFLNTVLGADASPSDRLVIGGGAASGSTFMEIIDAGGSGALTTGNGILVVETVNGGTTTAGAFALSSRVAAGAYEYLLFRGGVSAGTAENWYLRSTAPAPAPGPSPTALTPEPVPVAPEISAQPPPSEIPPEPIPTEGTAIVAPVDPSAPFLAGDPAPEAPPAPPLAAEPTPPPPLAEFALLADPSAELPKPNPEHTGSGIVPLYRGEVPTYAVIPAVSRYLAAATLGTFHERRGEQALLERGSHLPVAWGRVFGQGVGMSLTGTLTPSLDGALFGLQAGLDLLGWDDAGDRHGRIGIFLGHVRMGGDVSSPTLGGPDADFGNFDASGTSAGATWTHIAPQGWYLDGIVMATWFRGEATSNAGESIDVGGTGITLSLEGGYPFRIAPEWTLEPQAQIIWSHLALDNAADRFSSVSFDSHSGATGRIGLRLQGNFQIGGTVSFQPHFKANLWHDFDGEDRIVFDATPIISGAGGTALEVGGGVVASLNETTSLFATADYTTNLGGEKRRVLEGNIGITVKW